MSSVRNARCCTPAPACQSRKSSIWPGRRLRSGSSSTKVTRPDGLCTTLEFIALPADLDVLLEDLREAEHPLVVRDRLVQLAGRHADRQVVDPRRAVGRPAPPSTASASMTPGRKSARSPRRSTRRCSTSPKPATSAVTTSASAPVTVRGGVTAGRAPAHQLGVRRRDVVDLDRDDRDAVAVPLHVPGGRMLGGQPGGEQHPDVAVAEQQRALPGQPGLRAALAADLEADGGAEVEGRLPGVPHVEFDVVDATDVHVPCPLCRPTVPPVLPSGRAPPGMPRRSPPRLGDPREQQAHVVAAEPERVGQRVLRVGLARACHGCGPPAQAGSGSSRWCVGGSSPRRAPARSAAASSTPEAPSRWPVSALVELTGTPPTPKTSREGGGLGDVAELGAGAVRVDVADVRRPARPASRSAPAHARRRAGAVRAGRGRVVRVGGRPVAGHLGVPGRRPARRRARRAPAPAAPAPSAEHEPVAPRCRTAGSPRSGRSQPRASARALPKVSAKVGKSGASLAPQTTTSASPARISRTASATAWAPDAQAVPIDEL